MAKAKNKNGKSTPTFGKVKGKCRPVWGTIFFVVGILLFVSFLFFHPDQSGFVSDPHAAEADYDGAAGPNPVGRGGAEASWGAFYLLGGAAWLLPLAFFYFGYLLFRSSHRLTLIRFFAAAACGIAAASLLAMQGRFFTDEHFFHNGPGGIVGAVLYDSLLHYHVGIFGSTLLLFLIFGLGLLLLFTNDIGAATENAMQRYTVWKTKRAERKEQRAEEKRLRREEKEKERELQRRQKEEEQEKREKEKKAESEKKAREREEKRKKKSADKELDEALPDIISDGETAPPEPPPAASKSPAARPRLTRQKSAANEKPAAANEPDASPASVGRKPAIAGADSEKPKVYKSQTPKKAAFSPPKHRGDYLFPTLDLLSAPEPVQENDAEAAEETAELLVHTLKTFGVEAKVDEIHVGPVITRFDILPAPGTKVSKIQGLENDIAMGLKALAVRILAPVPGKGCVGIEIPNRTPQPVTLREIIESEDWNTSHAEIPIGLGKDVSGKPLVADLTRMPHLLIAGSTGSGKTVCINSVIASLLFHSSPERLRFIMVDPKIVEMKVFNDLPHMLIPVVTDPKKVPGALKWLIAEMERRYQVFAAVGVRNISGFHAHLKKEAEKKPEPEQKPETENAGGEHDLGHIPEAVAPEVEVPRDEEMDIPKDMPYIVCIIDELADLMMVAPAEVESAIARLAQLARAAGIHLILATQRPSVNVITGVIKANLPSRIAFKVASKIDSRTILDAGGAEQLIGRGDMLFLPPGTARLIRSQGAFVSDDEINAIVESLKQNGPPDFAEEIQRQIDQPENGENGDEMSEEDDELFNDALDVLRTTRRASTSMLQRKLRIGYNRAARLMELLEERNIVGPENGAQPREILVDPDNL